MSQNMSSRKRKSGFSRRLMVRPIVDPEETVLNNRTLTCVIEMLRQLSPRDALQPLIDEQGQPILCCGPQFFAARRGKVP